MWLICLATGSLNLLISLTYYPFQPPYPLAMTCLSSISLFCFVMLVHYFVFQVLYIHEIIWYLSAFFWLISLRQDTLGSSILSQNGISSFFSIWVILHCVYRPHLYSILPVNGHLGCFCILPYLELFSHFLNKHI